MAEGWNTPPPPPWRAQGRTSSQVRGNKNSPKVPRLLRQNPPGFAVQVGPKTTQRLTASLRLLLPKRRFQVVPSTHTSTYASPKRTCILQPGRGPQGKQDWAQQLRSSEQKTQVPYNINAFKKARSLMAFSPGTKGHSVPSC